MNNMLTRYVLPVLLPAIAAICGAFIATSSGPASFIWILVAFSAVLCSALILITNGTHTERAIGAAVSARADLATALARVGQPLIVVLGELAATRSNRSSTARTLLEKTLQVAQAQCGRSVSTQPEIRASFYQLNSNTLNLTYTAGSRKAPPELIRCGHFQQCDRYGTRRRQPARPQPPPSST